MIKSKSLVITCKLIISKHALTINAVSGDG